MTKIEKWLRKSAVRYRSAKIDRLRFLQAADKISDLEEEIKDLEDRLDRAMEPRFGLYAEINRLRTALRGGYDMSPEDEKELMAR